MNDFPLFPEQASTFAGTVDLLYYVLVGLSLVFAGLLPFVILYLIVRYHRSQKVDRSNPVISHLGLELTWTIIPLILVLAVFFWGAFVYIDMRTPPPQALEVYVIGKQWMWHTQHPNGKRENNELHVPIGQPVKLIMTSQDVIHSFYIPAFRVKQDVLPGRYTTMWFEATKPGEYHLFCAEYCGTEHSVMGGRVVALSLADYQQWLTTPGVVILPDGSTGAAAPTVPQVDVDLGTVPAVGDPMVQAGQQLFANLGCASCHRDDGAGQGPSLQGIFGETQALADGSAVVVDENYLRQSILNPMSQVVAGYNPIMPAYDGQVSDDQLNQLIAYIKSLSGIMPETSEGAVGPTAIPEPTAAVAATAGPATTEGPATGGDTGAINADLAAEGEQIFANLGCASCHRDDGAGIGPGLVGLFGESRPLADGGSVVADEAYIRESILNSTAKVAEGYSPIMPPYQGQVNDDQLAALVEYIKSLGE
ncbi:MAG: cytochrome c oxidase subunit II [Oscillochloris sp.]|nr:cytochrome c oxidase subunit II [Oscillochloris sp.]